MTSHSRRPRLIAAVLTVTAAAAVFVACEAPQPMAPTTREVYRVTAVGQQEFRVDESTQRTKLPDGRVSLVIFQRDGAVGVKETRSPVRVTPDTVRLVYLTSRQQ